MMMMVENNDFYINKLATCLFMCDISNRLPHLPIDMRKLL